MAKVRFLASFLVFVVGSSYIIENLFLNSVDAEFTSMTPPGWNAAGGQQMANIYTSCMNFQVPIQNAISSLGQGMISRGNPTIGKLAGMTPSICPLGAMATIDMVCPGSDIPPDISS